MSRPLPLRVLAAAAEAVDRRRPWHRLPPPLGVLMLLGLRERLRERNLYGTGDGDGGPDPAAPDHRTLDGTSNDPAHRDMGRTGARFGRNVPLDRTWPEREDRLLSPSPRDVSRALLTRERFVPATSLNVLAAAWLQFQIHDWFSHGKNQRENPWPIALAPGDPWPGGRMEIQRTSPDPTRAGARDGNPPTYANSETHWWDASQIYGTTAEFQQVLRSGEDGKLAMGEDGLPPLDLERGVDVAGIQGNFWLGLALLHLLFMREHNAICERLRRDHPTWADERLFQTARLVNAALLAKIHTVEWTPAIIAHPTTRFAMRANWWGLAGERLGRRLGHLGRGDLLSGIPGSRTDHHGAPYALTEEFVAVYRMHPLMPDDFEFRAAAHDRLLARRTFPEVVAHHARERLVETGAANALYSLGVAHPGALVLHNFPRFLQRFEKLDGTVVDLAAIDILRSRERGVPRYNEFRRLFHLSPARSFEALTPNRKWAEEIRRVYDGDVERVDLTVGLYAEQPPRRFGFSDTAFRVFALMASRRLKSDRFLSADYTARTYTRAGMDWINDTTMADVVLRHFPELRPALDGVENAFAPWRRAAAR